MHRQKIEKRGNELVISWKNSLFAGIILTFMGMIWTFVGLVLGFVESEPVLFVMPFIGFMILYMGLVFMINRTKIRASMQTIKVEQGPLPWFGNKEVRTSDVQQLFVIENGQKKVNNKVTPLYALKAKLKSSPHKPLTLAGLLDGKAKALEMEKVIERYLNIQDEAINIPEDPRFTKFKERFPALKDIKLPGPINEGKKGAIERTTSTGYKFDLDTGNEFGELLSSAPEVSGMTSRLLEGFADQDVFASRMGDHVEITGEDREIVGHVQYDWSDGRSDVAFRIRGNGHSTDIYGEQADGRKYLYFEERLLEEVEHQQLGFQRDVDPPNIVRNGDEKYYRRNEVTGYRFVDHGRSVNQVNQWIYFTTATHDRFRVVQAPGGKMRVYIQESLAGDNLRVAEKVSIKRGKGRK
ncbi:hypothetical protein CEQ90_13215 [Lewinellaceae bacterium SD302]|nr:hypothetical protein CEQ90_13215 [Lewinellaceae bacterium SD302]